MLGEFCPIEVMCFTIVQRTMSCSVAVTVPVSVFIAWLKVNVDQAAVLPSFFAFFVCGKRCTRILLQACSDISSSDNLS